MTDVRILSEPLGGTPLSLLIQRGDAAERVAARARPVGRDAWRQLAAERARAIDWNASWTMLEPALAASGAAAHRLDRVRREGGIVVTTGQQPGLFGGPIYTWTKAIGALALADAIERATGSRDGGDLLGRHRRRGLLEASSTVVARVGGADRLVQREARSRERRCRWHRSATSGAARPADHRVRQRAPTLEPLEAVRRAYGDPRRTVGDAYVDLLRDLLAPLGFPCSTPRTRPCAGQPARAPRRPRLGTADRARVAERRRRASRGRLRAAGRGHAGPRARLRRDGARKRRLAVERAASRGSVLTPNVLLLRSSSTRSCRPWRTGRVPASSPYFAQVSAVATRSGRPVPLAVRDGRVRCWSPTCEPCCNGGAPA
jgi:hypothetical protein